MHRASWRVRRTWLVGTLAGLAAYQVWMGVRMVGPAPTCPLCGAEPIAPRAVEVRDLFATCSACGALWSVATGFVSPPEGRELVTKP
jgi:hypothetical protein